VKVLVTGASGFVGSHVVRGLAGEGFQVRAMARGIHEERVPAGVEAFAGDVADPSSLRAAVAGMDAVVHLVAIIAERGRQTYERVNIGGTRNLLAAIAGARAPRLVHVSALGAAPDPRFPYLRSKWLAEEAVRSSEASWTILRPSAVFGEGAGFFRPIVWSLRWMPVYPMVAGGRTRFQPIAVEDLTRCVAASLRDPSTAGRTIDLGGPEVLEFGQIVRVVMEALGKRRRIVALPVAAARPFAAVNRLLRDPLVTNEQLDMVVLDNVCAPDSVASAFGFSPRRMADTDLRWLARL
jgi:NADH dehydrogenase